MNISDTLPDAFTPRELEVLRLVALGLSNRDIADELIVAPDTVRWYTKQIYSKLGISGRIQAVNRARELGLLDEGASSKTEPVNSAPQPANHNLPAATTMFVGRSAEIAEVKRLLQTSRLLTLTGVGGTGKTRLALRVAWEILGEFADGVYFVDLAPLSNAAQVAKAIAAALGIVENPAEPLPETLKRVLAEQEMLLLIDNYEHVIETAPLVAELLAAAPRLKVLVTSREPLRLSGEQEYAVAPLSLPSDEAVSIQEVTASEAGTLFVQRAKMLLPQFEVTGDNAPAIAQICARLDGLPLAIELAAARCKLLTPQALLARLDSRLTALAGGSRDAPARQRTLRDTIEWSHNLLDSDEKILFMRLAVFRGGRSLEAIEAICGFDLSGDVLDALASLVDKNLVQQKETAEGEPRFVLLETIHEYARERLAESGEAQAVRRRHAEYFVALAERAEPELRLIKQAYWYQLLDIEYKNLRIALEWSLSSDDITLAARLGGALHWFWFAYGYHAEGYQWTQTLLQRLDEIPDIYHAKLLLCAGQMTWYHNIDMAKLLFARARDVSRRLGDQLREAWALTFIGFMTMNDPQNAVVVVREGQSLFDALDYKPGIAQCLNLIGEIYRLNGDDTQARTAYDQSLALAQQSGGIRLTYVILANLAYISQHEGDYERAVDLIRQSLVLGREMNSKNDMASALQVLAGSLGPAGEPERAARLLGAAEIAFERMGAYLEPGDRPEIERIIAAVRARLDASAFDAAWAEGRKLSFEQAVAYALGES